MAEAIFNGNPIKVRKAARKITKTCEALQLTRDESLYCVKLVAKFIKDEYGHSFIKQLEEK
jgi:hypothetical protein